MALTPDDDIVHVQADSGIECELTLGQFDDVARLGLDQRLHEPGLEIVARLDHDQVGIDILDWRCIVGCG